MYKLTNKKNLNIKPENNIYLGKMIPTYTIKTNASKISEDNIMSDLISE